MPYATDADLLARVANADKIAYDTRLAALRDAETMIDDRSYAGKSVFAHVQYAAHLLACRTTGVLAGSAGAVTGMSAGEISATFASPPAESRLDSTSWGREFLAISETVPHSPEAV